MWSSSQSSCSRSPVQRIFSPALTRSSDSDSPVLLPSLPLPPATWSLTSSMAQMHLDPTFSSPWSTSPQQTCVSRFSVNEKREKERIDLELLPLCQFEPTLVRELARGSSSISFEQRETVVAHSNTDSTAVTCSSNGQFSLLITLSNRLSVV